MERKCFAITALVTACLILFAAAPCVQAGGWQPWNRLEGSWLRLQEGGANALIVFSPKGLLARKAAFRGSFANPSPEEVPPGTYVTDFIGEAVMTGPSTYEATAYAYIMAPNTGGRDVVAAIIVGTATGTFVNEDLVVGTTEASVYQGSQDKDFDLIPDEGESPVRVIPPQGFTDKRTPMVP